MVKICPICGKEFTAKPRQKYCSHECSDIAQSATKKKWRATHYNVLRKRVCPICGKEFTAKPRQKYCSHECSDIAQSAIQKKWRATHHNVPRKRVCPNCGKEFETLLGRKKYCSKECRLKAAENKRSAKCQATRAAFEKAGLVYDPYHNRNYSPRRRKKSEFELSKEQIAQREDLKQRLLQRRLSATDKIEGVGDYANLAVNSFTRLPIRN